MKILKDYKSFTEDSGDGYRDWRYNRGENQYQRREREAEEREARSAEADKQAKWVETLHDYTIGIGDTVPEQTVPYEMVDSIENIEGQVCLVHMGIHINNSGYSQSRLGAELNKAVLSNGVLRIEKTSAAISERNSIPREYVIVPSFTERIAIKLDSPFVPKSGSAQQEVSAQTPTSDAFDFDSLKSTHERFTIRSYYKSKKTGWPGIEVDGEYYHPRKNGNDLPKNCYLENSEEISRDEYRFTIWAPKTAEVCIAYPNSNVVEWLMNSPYEDEDY